ncbi:hypothetical protein [Achromobacter sp.]|uniref:hypothetical protein n=1 Tax=Achromobacter sp. TaxID=134375 RepID=UPI0028985D04|nr:hypothetical protein [Achromobacter sp.]
MKGLCPHCHALANGGRGEAHPRLMYRGVQQVDAAAPEHAGRRHEHFSCSACGTLWIRSYDRWGAAYGMQLNPNQIKL